MLAGHHGLDRLIAFVDYNKQQLDGYVKDINDPGDIAQRFESFGWNAYNADGEDVSDILEKINMAKRAKGKPSVIVLDTVKGQGLSFAEGRLDNHHMIVTKEQAEEALAVLYKQLKEVTMQ